ncbi:hypothetical protein KCP69_26435 [Salmonella enterica subsp. enterica]|nr:hypothetical protein KCP69_26435 [Salmonella enterica subsp. enterica]
MPRGNTLDSSVVPMKELVLALRRGDIIAHAFHGKVAPPFLLMKALS